MGGVDHRLFPWGSNRQKILADVMIYTALSRVQHQVNEIHKMSVGRMKFGSRQMVSEYRMDIMYHVHCNLQARALIELTAVIAPL